MLCLFNSMVSMCAPLARVRDTYKVFADQRNRQFLVVGDAVLWATWAWLTYGPEVFGTRP